MEDQAPVTIKDPFFPQEMIQMKLTMWKESKYSKHLSPPPLKLNSCSALWAAAYQVAGLLCVFGNCLLLLVVGAKVGQWDWHHSTTASCTSPNYPKNDTIEKELLRHRSVCVFTQSVLCASSGFNARLPFICCC